MNKSAAHIYIVDDDNPFGMSLQRMLQTKDYIADYFPSAQSFLDAVPSDSANAIAIIDLHMPECDGVMLMQNMQATGYHMPVIIITGQVQANTESMVLRSGAVGFLEKPFSVQSLLKMINRCARH